jgi:hypothetical protein
MAKCRNILTLVLLSFSAFGQYRSLSNESFKMGEAYDYKVKLGILTLGEAKVEVGKTIANINQRPCYQINILGKTAGITDLYKVRNTYKSYLDTAAILPQRFYMNVAENKFKKEQTIAFDHSSNIAKVEEKDFKKNFELPSDIQDVVSIYYYFRTLNFGKMATGDAFNLKMFFDKEIYNMRFKYLGREVIATKFGKVAVFKIIPMLPANKLFDGENAIKIWVTDDKNRIPIRVVADMSYVGNVTMDITSFKGNKHPIKWIK